YAKPGLVRTLIIERVDPVLFEMSYDYVGDLSETAALLWPVAEAPPGGRGAEEGPSLTAIVEGLRASGKVDLPGRLAGWLDGLDEIGRWALLKLITGALRVGVSARLTKQAIAVFGNRPLHEIEDLWHA